MTQGFSIFDAILVGAIGMAAMILMVIAAIVAVWKVWPMLRDLTHAFGSLSAMMKGVGPALEGIRSEMAFMRQVAVPGAQVGSGAPAVEEVPYNPDGEKPASVLSGFPAPEFGRYPVVPEEPDAKMEDTVQEHLSQTEEDLERQEQLEVLRERGVVVEDSDAVHEGIEVESK